MNDWFNLNVVELSKRLHVIESVYDVVKHTPDGKLFLDPPGHQHYHLLAYISSKLPSGSKILEIGTRRGETAIALRAGNPDISITTCDLEDMFIRYSDIEFIHCNGLDIIDRFKDAQFIFIDVDPHDGKQERVMIQKLKDVGFKGILMLDDIHINEEMYAFWNDIDLKKIDATSIGHYSGTGFVSFI